MWYIHKFPATIYAIENNSVSPVMSKAHKYNFMNLNTQLKNLADEYGFLDPLSLLMGFANGQDLRGHSLVYQKVLEIEEEFGDAPPDTWEWDELIEMIKNDYRFLPVSRSTSEAASKTLLEYQHNKKKSVEVTDKSAKGEVTELSRTEVRRFLRVFNKEY